MMKRLIILVALVSLMINGCSANKKYTVAPKGKSLSPTNPEQPKIEKPEPPKSQTEKNRITYRITVIIREIIVDNVDDVEGMLPEDKKQEKKGDGMLLAD